jgi:hypothetical protein
MTTRPEVARYMLHIRAKKNMVSGENEEGPRIERETYGS